MKAEIRNQIIAMLYQNMDKADADDTLQLVDKYATAQQPGGGEEAKDFMEKNCTEIQLGAGVGYLVTPKLLNDYARSYTPPVAEGEITDEKIEQVACDEMQQDWNDLAYQRVYHGGFVDGAKWARLELTNKQKRDGHKNG